MFPVLKLVLLTRRGPRRCEGGLGTYPTFSMTDRIRSAVSGLTLPSLLITRETVVWDTPASFATSTIDIHAPIYAFLALLPLIDRGVANDPGRPAGVRHLSDARRLLRTIGRAAGNKFDATEIDRLPLVRVRFDSEVTLSGLVNTELP